MVTKILDKYQDNNMDVESVINELDSTLEEALTLTLRINSLTDYTSIPEDDDKSVLALQSQQIELDVEKDKTQKWIQCISNDKKLKENICYLSLQYIDEDDHNKMHFNNS